MNVWGGIVELFRALLFGVSHVCGGSIGLAILACSLLLRLALLPLTLRYARRAVAQRRILERIQPELKALQQLYPKDPVRVYRETQALQRASGLRTLDVGSLLVGFAQLPIVLAFYGVVRQGLGSARRFLWIGDLARPDAWLAIGVSVLTSAALLAAPATAGPVATRVMAVLAGVVTFLVMAKFASAVGLYWVASSGVALLQGGMLRRAHAHGARHSPWEAAGS